MPANNTQQNIEANTLMSGIDHRIKHIESKLNELSTKHNRMYAKIPYNELRKRVFTVFGVTLVLVWLLLNSPLGSYLGINGLWEYLIEHAAIAMNPACQAPPGGEPCTPGSPAYMAYVEAAERARNSLLAANRNLITVVLPLLIGVVIWLITVVAERRLKTYDETIENIRNELRDALETIKKQLDHEIDLLIHKSLDEATSKIEQTSQARHQEIETIRNELETRFKDLRPFLQNENDAVLSSIGALHKKVTELFSSDDDTDQARAISLAKMAFGRSRPYKS